MTAASSLACFRKHHPLHIVETILAFLLTKSPSFAFCIVYNFLSKHHYFSVAGNIIPCLFNVAISFVQFFISVALSFILISITASTLDFDSDGDLLYLPYLRKNYIHFICSQMHTVLIIYYMLDKSNGTYTFYLSYYYSNLTVS